LQYSRLRNIIWLTLTFVIFIMIFLVFKYIIVGYHENIHGQVEFIKNSKYILTSFIVFISLVIFLLVTYFLKRIEILDREIRLKDSLLTNNSKLVEMGGLIDNIAHQWKQPLSIISIVISDLKVKKEFNQLTDELIDNAIEISLNNINYQAQTIDDFRNFYKSDKKEENFTLEKVFDLNMKLIGSTLKNNNVKVDLNIDDIRIYGLKNELVQAILNILNNSNDVFSKKNNQSDNYIMISALKKTEYAIIIIHDNAGGIPDEYLDKVFINHFTTKKDSGGTGVGLFVSREIIVKNMLGKLNVKNEGIFYKNKKYLGAKFIIELPLA